MSDDLNDDAPETPVSASETPADGSAELHEAPGTMVLTLIFLLTFAIYFFANWKALSDVWPVR